jgi:para-aminobenzoate synthetase component 1
MPTDRRLPLIHFGVFDAPQPTRTPSAVGICCTRPIAACGLPIAAQAFSVHDYIGAGDIYQVNLTFPIATRSGSIAGRTLCKIARRQAVPTGRW